MQCEFMVPNRYYRLAKSCAWWLALFIGLALGAGAAHAQALRVEAESYNNAYDTTSGNQFTNPINQCTYNGLNVDVSDSGEGTCIIGWVDSGEWLEYTVNVPTTGAYRLAYRYSSGNTGSVGQIVFKSNGSTLATTSLTQGTGDWGVFTTQYTTVNLNAGTQTIRLEFNSPVLDLNWFELEYATVSVPATGETRIETENYLSAWDSDTGNNATAPSNCTYYGQNVDIGDTTDGGGCAVGYTANGEWLEYSINVAEADTYTLRYRWGSGNSGSLGSAYFKVNGSTLATTSFSGGTGSWDLYTTQETTVALSAGIQTVRLEWSNPQINMNWFSLEKGTSSGGGSGPGTCSFPSAGAVSVESATVEVQGGAYIHNSPNNQLVTKNINVHGDSCGSGVACTKTDTVAPLFTDVPSIPGGSNINVPYNTTQSIAPGNYGQVYVDSSATLNLQPGTYTFNGNVHVNSSATVTITSPGLTKIYINGRFDTGNASVINSTGASGTETLFVYATSEVALQNATQAYAVIYSKARATLQNNMNFYGAVTSENYVILGYGVNLYYDETMVGATGYGTGCSSGGTVTPTASASWRMEQNWWDGTSGEVVDSGSYGLHGTATNIGSLPRVGRAVPAIAGDPGTCHYAEFADRLGYIRINDPGTGSVLDASEFTVSAWIYPTEYPSSDVYTIVHKGGLFELHLLPSGGFRVDWYNGSSWVVFLPSGTAPLNTWSHVAYSYTNGEQKLYLNGVLQGTGTDASGYYFDNEPIIIGNDLYPNTRGFKGRIDEVNFFNYRLSASEVTALYGDTHDCPAQTNYAVAQWAFDETSWTGTSGEVQDASGNGNHATAYSNGGFPNTSNSSPAISGDPGTCYYGDFYLGNDGYVAHGDGSFTDFDTPELTLALWLRPEAFPSSGTDAVIRKGGSYEFILSSSGALTFRWLSDSTWYSLAFPSALTLNQWAHVAVTFATGSQKLYLNGAEVASAAQTEPFDLSNEDFVIGADYSMASGAFEGFVDEVNIYGNYLSAADIAAIYAETRACPSSGGGGSCSFPSAISAAADAATVTIDNGAQVQGSPDNQIVTKNLSAGTDSCGSGIVCTKTDTVAPAYSNVPSIPGGSNVNVVYMGSQSLSPGDYGAAHFDDQSTVTLSPGQYTFNGNLAIDFQSTLAIAGTGHVEIYVNGNVTIDGSVNVNTGGGETQTLFIYSTGQISAMYRANVRASLYSVGALFIHNEVTVAGTLSSETSVQTSWQSVLTFNQAIADAASSQCTGSGGPASITVTASASASTCAPQSVTITVKDALDAAITDYTGTVTLSTSTGNGDWSKTGTASDAYGTLTAGASDSGSATYTFDSSDNGSITLLLANERTESLTISAVESVNAASGNSSAIGYTTNSYRKTDVTGGVRVVGYPQVWRVEMMAKDPSTGECSVNSGYSQTGVKAWLARSTNDPGGAAPTLIDNTTSATATPPNSEPGSNNFNLTFVNGVAEFTINTTDVLQATLHIADKTRAFADVDLAMDTGEQTYGPFGFDISVTGNPEAASAGGAAFQNAGQNFTVTARAVAWQAADDLDNNKIPDNHASSGQTGRADLSDNNALVSFGQESPAETLTLSASLLLPAGGTNPGLGDGDTGAADARVLSAFTAGASSTSQVYFDEVGIIEISAAVTDNDYLGMGGDTANSQSYSATVGRFIPARFSFGGNSLTEACQSGLDFSYLGQSFSGEFTVTPKSDLGTSVQNYTGGFIKLGTGDFDFYARDLLSATALTSRLASSVDSLSFSGGVGTASATFTLARASNPDGPFTQVSLGTDFSDSDGAALATSDKDLDSDGDTTNDAASLGETELRFGRLRLGNAHGPETAALSVPMVVEYWDSPDWLVNSDDSCSQIERAEISYPDGTINFSSNRTITVGSGSTTGSYSTIVGDAVQFAEGDSGLSFSAPGSGNMASFTTGVDLTNYPWLRFDWDGDGSYTDTAVPDNTVNFGSYRGHDRMIFWQEY